MSCSSTTTSINTSIPLQTRLANALSTTVKLIFHHVVSESCECPEVFAAPPGEHPESTISESHFLSASILHDGQLLQVFAVEVYVYTTPTLTTIFVSKADSTGHLHLLNLPKGSPSPIKTTITTFLEWLVEGKKRKDARLLLSLFARAQNQYLFPGSVENTGKHVLDDRGLIRWWCRVLDPILHSDTASEVDASHRAQAYLIVPGLDPYETRSYYPKTQTYTKDGKSRWSSTDPLKSLGKSEDLPTRCYIPRFPDDPKARFVIDLDDELPEDDESEAARKGKSPGIWRSVKTLAQFWELMAFRQECAAGRLVGFIWAVFEPAGLVGKPSQAVLNLERAEQGEPTLPTPRESQQENVALSTEPLDLQNIDSSREDILTPVPSSQPQPEEANANNLRETEHEIKLTTESTLRGKLIDTGIQLQSVAYKDVLLVLDNLDYSNLELALKSTAKFVQAVSAEVTTGIEWSFEIQGRRESHLSKPGNAQSSDTAANGTPAAHPAVNVLGTSIVRSRKRPVEDIVPIVAESGQSEVRVLSSSLIRKKPKS